MTKVKLVDADELHKSILHIASMYSYQSPMMNTQPYFGSGMDGVLQQFNYEIQRTIGAAVTEGVRQALFQIAYKVHESATEKYGCVLCRPGDDEVPPHPLKGHINGTANGSDSGF